MNSIQIVQVEGDIFRAEKSHAALRWPWLDFGQATPVLLS